MRNILEYPITQEEKNNFILSNVLGGGIGDPTPTIFAEILTEFAEGCYGIYGEEELKKAAYSFLEMYKSTLAYITQQEEARKATLPTEPFTCPECGSHWFGSSWGEKEGEEIHIIHCHDQFEKNCNFSGLYGDVIEKEYNLEVE